MPWILAKNIDSKMRVFRNFHFKRKSDSRSDDKNVKVIINENDNNSIQFFSQKSLPKIQSTSGVTTTNRQGNAADPMMIRTQRTAMRNLMTVLKLSMH